MNRNHAKNICEFINSLEPDEKNLLLRIVITGSINLFECLATDYVQILNEILINNMPVLFQSAGIKCAAENDYEGFLSLINDMKIYVTNYGMDR